MRLWLAPFLVALTGGVAFAADVPVMRGASLPDVIASASPGDVLLLGEGVFAGPLVIDKPLTLKGTEASVIDGQGDGTVITISAPDVTIEGLTVTGSGRRNEDLDAGIKLVKGADRALIAANHLHDNLHGIDVHGAIDARVIGNDIIGGQDPRMMDRGNGIYIWNSPGTLIEGNSVRYGRDGIFSNTSRKGIYRNNIFRDLRFAIHHMYTHDSEVSGNISIGNHLGYAIMYSDRVVLKNNLSLGDRDHGVMLNFANQADISGNLVRGGTKKCLFMYNANKDLIVNNRFEGCGIGIHYTAGSDRNVLTGNAFVGNMEQVKYVGTRFLEWSFEGAGNYWSDLAAFDLNGDGRADGVYRPNDLMDKILWSQPQAHLLMGAPAVQLVRWSQSNFPAILPGGVVDSFPLMTPISIPVPDDIAALEAEVAGRWAQGTYDDIDPEDLGSH
ncbi:MAG: nitrous oxide reductase family maturation protein NosD [Paracoccaceae bacterium]